jgi:cytochrome c-type biogenesis protein CcmF
VNPLMNWIWIGVAIVVFGTVLALVPNMARKAARAAVEPRLEVAEVHHV